MTTDAMGSAAWSNSLGDEAFRLAERRHFVLGRPVRDLQSVEPVYGRLHLRAPAHILSIAQTRSGKGVSLIIPNLLAYHGSAFVLDPKGENAWVTAKWRREGLGQKVYILDPWGEVNASYGVLAGEQETISRFNPLSSLDPQSEEFIDQLAYIADALVIATPGSKEPYWEDSARDLISGLIAFIIESPDVAPENRTLGMLRALLNQSNDELRGTCWKAKELPSSVAAMKLGRFCGELNTDVTGVMSAARTQTIFLDSPSLQASMGASDFSFEELASQAATVYVVIPADKLATYSRWLRLMVSMALRAIQHVRAPENLPVLFMLDEFGTIGKLQMIETAYGLMRGYGIALWAFLQDINQLRTHYAKSADTFVANSGAMTCFGIMDDPTAEYISKMLGTKTASYETFSESTGSSSSAGGNSSSVGTSRSVSSSTAFTGRALLMPDELRRLNDDLCIVLGRHKPILCRRLAYYEDYPFYIAARSDPRHGTPEQQRVLAEKKTALALAHLARQQISDFESAKAALRPCGLTVEKNLFGSIAVSRGGQQIAKFRSEKSFVPKAQEIMAEGFRRLKFVF